MSQFESSWHSKYIYVHMYVYIYIYIYIYIFTVIIRSSVHCQFVILCFHFLWISKETPLFALFSFGTPL